MTKSLKYLLSLDFVPKSRQSLPHLTLTSVGSRNTFKPNGQAELSFVNLLFRSLQKQHPVVFVAAAIPSSMIRLLDLSKILFCFVFLSFLRQPSTFLSIMPLGLQIAWKWHGENAHPAWKLKLKILMTSKIFQNPNSTICITDSKYLHCEPEFTLSSVRLFLSICFFEF